MFLNRYDAGEKLAEKLEKFKAEDVVVLAIPRGGVETAYNTIKKFNFKWDLITPRKIGAPHNEEVAIGAVSMDGTYVLDEKIVQYFNIPDEYIKKQVASELIEIKRRLREYRGDEDPPDVKNKVVIVIDDGIATGFTLLAAIESIKKLQARKIIIAVPVAPSETVERFSKIVDEVICLLIPSEFYAVGMHYESFPQVTDKELFSVMDKLKNK
ncbi:phosphoribosyltransferase [Clostridium aciditolerans]|uniref:Phosphoribosyltransferase n=2 Tax=Clostridium aciditolerans TaxID=339861 RepID=A0A934HV88_9CLOT|nr:phosphoribosyltransferase [Clostridium aciditolerans]